MQSREFGSRSVGFSANKGRNGCLRVRQWVSGKEAAAASLPANRIAEGLHRPKPPSWKGQLFHSPGAGMPPPCHSEARYGPKNPYLNGRDGFFASLRMTGVV